MPNFDVVERKGNVAKVEYENLGTTGYRRLDTGEETNQQAFAGASRAEQYEIVRDESGKIKTNVERGEGTTIPPERNYRSTGIIEDDYGPTNTDWGVEVWIVTESPDVTKDEVWSKMEEAMRYARREIPVIGGSKKDAKIRTNQRVNSPTHDWRGVVRVKGHKYQVDFNSGEISW